MADLPTTDAATLCDIIANNEDWLIDRILLYARRQGFNHCASTLREAWRLSIHGLSAPILSALGKGIRDMEFKPDEEQIPDDL
jgi:hypothetical protein